MTKFLRRFILVNIILLLGLNDLQAYEWNRAEIDSMANRAETTVLAAYEMIWDYRVRQSIADTVNDPDRTGMIGEEYTMLTTTIGYPKAKQLSTTAGWASWLVMDLATRGIAPGDKVAVSLSGSFPGLNVAVLAALQELGADVRAISSIGASSWGANVIGLSWPEMERILRDGGILKVGSSAVTLGGTGDRGAEWGAYSLNLALEAVRRSRLPLLQPTGLRDAIRKRLRFYGERDDYFCYINVGGGQASLGGGDQIRYSYGGWYYKPSGWKGNPRGVMDYFLKTGVPSFHLLHLNGLSRRYFIVQ